MIRFQVCWWKGLDFVFEDCEIHCSCSVADICQQKGILITKDITLYGVKIHPTYQIKDGDRIEVHSKIVIDPMEARKMRHKLKLRSQGE